MQYQVIGLANTPVSMQVMKMYRNTIKLYIINCISMELKKEISESSDELKYILYGINIEAH